MTKQFVKISCLTSYIDPLGANEMPYKILEINHINFKKFEFPMNLISMLLYDGGLLCIELIGEFLEKPLENISLEKA